MTKIEIEHFDADPDGEEGRAGDGYYFRVLGEDDWSGAWHSTEEALEMAREEHGDVEQATAAEIVAAEEPGSSVVMTYPEVGDRVTTEDGAAVVHALDYDRGADFAPLVILDLSPDDAATAMTRRTESVFLIRTGPNSWRERLPRAGTVGGAAPHQVLEVGDIFHGAPLPAEPLPMAWRADLSDHAGGHALVIVADADAGREEAWVLDVLFSDRAQGDALRPMIQEAAQRIMMQPPEALDLTPGAEGYAMRFPLEHKATATRAYSDGFSDGANDMTLADLLEPDEAATILAALRYYQENGQGDPANRSDAIHNIATDGDAVISLDDDGIEELCQRINLDKPRAPVAAQTA